MEDAKERIERVLVYTQKSARSLAEFIGAKPQQFYDICRGKTGKLPLLLADRIVRHYPEINRAWLISGEGDMLTDTVESTVESDVVISAETWRVIRDLAATVKSQQEELRELRASTPALAQKKSAGL